MEKSSVTSAINAIYTIGVIFSLHGIGNFISKAFSKVIVIPGNIIGMMILFLLLQSGILKYQKLQATGSFLLRHMSLFFIPFAVSIIKYYPLISGKTLQFFLVILVSTVAALALSAFVVDKSTKGVSR